jgi:hypothetical protein
MSKNGGLQRVQPTIKYSVGQSFLKGEVRIKLTTDHGGSSNVGFPVSDCKTAHDVSERV